MPQILQLLFFPGVCFLFFYAFLCAAWQRRLYSRMQNRRGPRWSQPLADFFKLLGKEAMIAQPADRGVLTLTPAVALSAVCVAFIYVPIYNPASLHPFAGDIIVVIYLLTLPALCVFLAGWYSSSLFATIGSVRVLTQIVACELPLIMALLAPFLLAGTWSLSVMAAFYQANPLVAVANLPAFCIALLTCQGKLMRLPFDMPLAQNELGGGALCQLSGSYYALFRLALDCEAVVMASLIAAVFIPFYPASALAAFGLYLVKTLTILLLLTWLRAVSARLRIEQLAGFCWKYLVPLALIQLIVNLLVKGVIT